MHKLYLQKDLPYLSVKLCPNCNNLVPVESFVCTTCNYHFKTGSVKNANVESNNATQQPNQYQDINQYVIDNNINPSQKQNQNVNNNVSSQPTTPYVPQPNMVMNNQGIVQRSNEDVNSQVITNNINQGNSVNPNINYNNNNVVYPNNMNQNVINGNNQNPNVNYGNSNVITPNNITNTQESTASVDETKEKEYSNNATINLGRKRLFVIIQMVLMALILAVILILPIMTKNSFFNSLAVAFDSSKGSNGEIMSGINFFSVFFGLFKGGSNVELIASKLTNSEGHILFADVSFIHSVLGIFSKGTSIYPIVSFIIVSGIYLATFICTIILYVTSIFGLFKATPFKGKALGSLVTVFAIGCVLIYATRFSKAYSGYDSWLLYAFVLTFLLWFIIKIVFGKEEKIYKKYHKEEDI